MQGNDIVFIRHAESEFNKKGEDFAKDNQIEYNWPVLSSNSDFMKNVRYNNQLVDCSIT